jgi:hypothetical protein
MFGAIANTPVAAKRGLPAVRTLISCAASGADNAACTTAFRAVDRVALVSDGAVLKRVAIRSGGYAAAGCGGVAVADVVAEGHGVLAVVADLLSRNEIVDWHDMPLLKLRIEYRGFHALREIALRQFHRRYGTHDHA